MPNKIFLLPVLLAFAITARAQGDWQLNTVKDGIKLYTRPVAGLKIKSVKVECAFPVTAAQLVAVIMDIDNNSQWVYHNKLTKLIKKVSPLDLYYYSEVSVPWPAQNRDFVSHITVTQNLKTKVVNVDAVSVPDMAPVKDKIVRITHSIDKWTITPQADNTIKVSYELEVDPAGSTPAWLVNLFVYQGPMETFQKLKQQVLKPEYKNAKLGLL